MSFVTYFRVSEVTEIMASTIRKIDLDGYSIVAAKIKGAYFAFLLDCSRFSTNQALGSLNSTIV